MQPLVVKPAAHPAAAVRWNSAKASNAAAAVLLLRREFRCRPRRLVTGSEEQLHTPGCTVALLFRLLLLSQHSAGGLIRVAQQLNDLALVLESQMHQLHIVVAGMHSSNCKLAQRHQLECVHTRAILMMHGRILMNARPAAGLIASAWTTTRHYRIYRAPASNLIICSTIPLTPRAHAHRRECTRHARFIIQAG